MDSQAKQKLENIFDEKLEGKEYGTEEFDRAAWDGFREFQSFVDERNSQNRVSLMKVMGDRFRAKGLDTDLGLKK